ncbi:MAG: chromosome segregation ATPase [Jaaginema sp. PMC 1079.18]|nr:chromosome segregation ATPase [Jaaginema sp. PMC 1080.18]MEC4852037.1 chromosome segregation ATPase [Jaaginema sp. PMC 1079.18]MEC4867593.1 chromosome segregation ATPase [Jaaginema sp. PMC 1078.18]
MKHQDRFQRLPKLASPRKLKKTKAAPSNPELTNNSGVFPSNTAAATAVYPQPEPEVEDPPERKGSRWLWLVKWQTWGVLLVVATGSLGFVATAALLRLPALPSCPQLYLPMASASMRLYCAQLAADKQTREGLLEAIALVEALPSDHPMRPEINRNLELWALDLLDLAEETYQDGKLEDAIATVQDVSRYIPPKDIEERIARWRSTWAEAEKIAKTVEDFMTQAKWAQAFRSAAKLTNLGNRYWATTRYRQLYERIELAQEESRKLDKAYAALQRGSSESLLEAIKLAEEIPPESTAYKEAQTLMKDAGDKLLDLALARLEAGAWTDVMAIANKFPLKLGLQEEMQDLNNLAEAGSKAAVGTVAGLELAIQEAESVPPGRPMYDRAQKLIRTWRSEIQAVTHLEEAERLAVGGGLSDLGAAIAQARLVSSSNPRHGEAQRKISQWTSRIEAIEDRPILDQAEALASSGTDSGLQSAIAEANKIRRGRALYSEAQRQNQRWRNQLQRNQDQPILSQAQSLANRGDLDNAINVAQKIQRDRALYDEARSNINRWRGEQEGQRNLDRAYQLAQGGNADSIAAAIATAKRIPATSSVYNQSVQAIDNWSSRLLALAAERADVNLNDAIAIAEKIPEGTSAYQGARAQIEVWRQRLQPQVPQTSPILDNIPSDEPAPVISNP